MSKKIFLSNETAFPWIIKINLHPVSIEFSNSDCFNNSTLIPAPNKQLFGGENREIFLIKQFKTANCHYYYTDAMAKYIFPKTVYTKENSIIKQILKLVEQYFYSHTTDFSAVKIIKNQLTPFQFAVLERVAALPFGTFQTYGETANNLGNSNQARAVGNALGANPLPLIIPCHRILLKTGIGGYSSGRAIKQWLLRFEGIPGKYLF